MDKKKLSLKEIGLARLLLLLFAGTLLIVLSVSEAFSGEKKKENKETSKVTENNTNQNTQEGTLLSYEKRLKEVLSKVAGVGKVEVMITEKESKELVVLKDKPYAQETLNETDTSGGSRSSASTKSEEETVLTNGNNVPFVTKEVAAQIEGVLVIAEGGANGDIAANITAAVQALFNVPAHKVKVLPMEK